MAPCSRPLSTCFLIGVFPLAALTSSRPFLVISGLDVVGVPVFPRVTRSSYIRLLSLLDLDFSVLVVASSGPLVSLHGCRPSRAWRSGDINIVYLYLQGMVVT